MLITKNKGDPSKTDVVLLTKKRVPTVIPVRVEDGTGRIKASDEVPQCDDRLQVDFFSNRLTERWTKRRSE